MYNSIRWFLGVLGLVLVGITPYLWLYKHTELLLLSIPLILIWAFWLMLEYLRWAKSLGKK